MAKCNSTAGLRPVGSFFEGTRVDHGAIILGIWCWAHKMAPGQVVAATGLCPHAVTDIFHNLRIAATGVAMDLDEGELLGGGGNIVVIDEALASRRKYNKGRVVPTSKICIFGGVEIKPEEGGDASGGRPKYVETGRCFMVRIPDRTRETFEREIKKRVAPGTLVWTDSHKSYDWLPSEGLYAHQKVNHKRGEWVGNKGQSTNAIEGMWSRAKRSLRLANTRRPVDNDYAPLLGEFMWRARFARGSDWRKRVFSAALRLVSQEHGVDFQREMWGKLGFPCEGEASLWS